MKYKIVVIKGIEEKIIKENDVWVYQDHFCKCGCGGKIHWYKCHKYAGIPDFISNHDKISIKTLKIRNEILTAPTIFENGIKVYENIFCDCENEDGINCGLRIPYPIDRFGINNHRKRGIPKVIQGHYSKEMNEKNRIRNSGINNPNYGKPKSEETKNKTSKSRKKWNQEHPEEAKKFSSAGQKYWKDNPDKLAKHIQKMCEAQTFLSEPELIVRNYTIKKLDKLNIKYHLNLCKIKGIPDITIETGDGHPIALFEDGCFIHGCRKCIKWNEVRYDLFEWIIEKKHYDKIITENLMQQGYRVIRIWQHDVDNGNYKKIIKRMIADIKAHTIISTRENRNE